MADFYFNLPTFDDLNETQKAAVIDIEPISLSGGPGTGKSVVSLWRHIINHSKEKPVSSLLLTYTTTLSFYLKACCKQNNGAFRNVDSTLNWYYNNRAVREEIIIDEAQDMAIEFNKKIKSYSKVISYGADNQQILKAKAKNPDGTYNLDICSPEEELKKLFSNYFHKLDRNYRSTQRIMKFAKAFFQEAFIHNDVINNLNSKIGSFPRLLISNGNIQKQNSAIIDIISQFSASAAINIAVLVPFESFGSTEHYAVKYYYDLIKNSGNEFDCSMYTSKMNEKGCEDIKSIHVTTFKSAKGLEFDVVILPNFQLANYKFEVINWRDFYVGVTRAKSSLILISNTDIPSVQNHVEKVHL